MPSPENFKIEDYQLTAARIASRAAKDPAFKERVLANPVKVLVSYGLSRDATRELILEDAYLRERFGTEASKLADDGWCITTECCCTDCCVTCWVGSSVGNLVFGALDPLLTVEPARQVLLTRLIQSGHIVTPLETWKDIGKK
jgi:hypothetical protein